jgi:phospholipase C
MARQQARRRADLSRKLVGSASGSRKESGMRHFRLLVTVLALVAAACASVGPSASAIGRINHIVVIYQENWSFDGLFGNFPGANGLANAGDTVKQTDKDGRPYATLPASIDNRKRPPAPDLRIPAELPVAPFNLGLYVRTEDTAGNPIHRFYHQQYQINGGKMDRFIPWSGVGGLVMSYYDATDLPIGRLAQEYVLADNFFHAAFGGSFLNHVWLVCACTPYWPVAPAAMRAQVDANGLIIKDGDVTPDGYVVNTAYTVNVPHPEGTAPSSLLPNLTQPTIGDRLDEKGVSWAWYSGGWRDALAGRPHPNFQFHHQPFAYFANWADGTAKAQHLKDEDDFLRDLEGGTLPAVSFVKPLGPDNEHPGYASLLRGQEHVAALVRAIMVSRAWDETAIIITYDENGGRWDHVPPPQVDRWGPGVRVPTIVISPFARRRYVDHTYYDTTSILKLIERRWNLPPLGPRDAAANDLSNAFDSSARR